MEEKEKKRLDGKLIIFAAIALGGLLLLLFGGLPWGQKDTDAEQTDVPLDPDSYSDKIESEVEALCRSVAGNCEVKAVVSLSGGYRSVYASDSQSSPSGYKNSMVLIGSGSSEGAVLVCYENPEISGIGIVLSCRGDENLKNCIVSLISAAFDVKTNKIHVAFGG